MCSNTDTKMFILYLHIYTTRASSGYTVKRVLPPSTGKMWSATSLLILKELNKNALKTYDGQYHLKKV